MKKSRAFKQERHTRRTIRKQAKVRSQHRSGKQRTTKAQRLYSTPQARLMQTFIAQLVNKALHQRDVAREYERTKASADNILVLRQIGRYRSQRRAA